MVLGSPRVLRALMLPAIFAGCVTHSDDAGPPGVADHAGALGVADAGSDHTIDAVEDGGDAATDSAGPTCYVDFPCSGIWSCDNEKVARRMESRDCTFRCGEQPCSGGSCEPTSVTVTCPEGTRCKTPDPYTLAFEPCTAIDDAGPDGATDAEGIDGG